MRSFLLAMILLVLTATIGLGQKPVRKDSTSGSQFDVTVELNGRKTEIKYLQFESADGMAYSEGAANGRLVLQYGASNSKDEKNFAMMSWIARPEKGEFALGDSNGASFTFTTSLFSDVPMFIGKEGTIKITAMPQAGGFVEGTFVADCDNVKDDGSVETYHLTGSFKLVRR